ncbi:DNA/RNA non-specific endonuclease, partial [Bacillus sonorensis]|uniref:DNA/RNA non-specific endonuclease n=1 Tax=Bacillus sonorensis TaxID=119858 RepID=UPI002DBFE4C5
QKDTNVDTLATPHRVKKLIEKYKIHNESVYNIEKLKFIKYKIKTPNVQVKRFEMPWGPGKISKFGRASEIRKALTENPLKADEVSKIEKDARTARDVGIVKKNEIIKDGSHITKSGKLKSNVKYQAGEYNYIYKTDKEARIKEFQADDLKLTKRDKRLPHNPKTPGKQLGDHAGHLAADRFGGSPELDNLVSQSSNVNQSKYKKLENKWAKAISDKKKVSVNVKVNYDGNNPRPKSFEIKYSIDGNLKKVTLKN